ncbi:MAG: fatty acid desaturase [Bryobacteraceae bacterium]
MHWVWVFALTFGIVEISIFFSTIYLHRMLTHRGLDLHPAVATPMHLELTLFTGVVPREWVAVHRKHHHFSDAEGDPHSPRLFGMWHVLFGNYFYYRKEIRVAATIRKYTPDYQPDFVDRLHLGHYGIYGGLAIFILLFGFVWGPAAWLFHIVVYIFLNSTINSLCHMIGYRNYDNLATNLRWVAMLTGGEGLHNNHHEFPSSARFSQRSREWDPAWLAIRLLASLGLAKVKPVPVARAA